MASLLEMKRNLDAALKSSRLSSGGMRITQCSIDIDSAAGLVTVRLTVNTGTLPKEAVEELAYNAFESVGVRAFAEWQDISFDHTSPSVTRIRAEGLMTVSREA